MYKQLLLDNECVPILCDYELEPLKSSEVRVQSLFGSPKHGTETTFVINDPYAGVYYDGETRLFMKKAVVEPCAGSFPLGNMFVGIVIETTADAVKVKVGDKVAGYGGLKEIHTIHENDLWLLNERMTWQEAVCFDPLQYALGGVRDGNVRAGDKVLVSGLGAIGLMAAQLVKRAGATLVAVSDPIAKRREVALQNGADIAFDPTRQDVGLELRKYTRNVGVDVVVETSGSYAAMEQGFRALGFQGTQCMVGWMQSCHTPIHLGYEPHWNHLKLIFSAIWRDPNPDHPRYSFRRIQEECWDMLGRGWFNCENIIDPIVRFEECAKAYKDVILDHPEKSVKMGVVFNV